MVMQINSTGGVDAQLGCLHHTHSGGITRNGGIVVVLRGKGCRVSARWTSASLDTGWIRFLKLLLYSSRKLTRMDTSSSLLKSLFLSFFKKKMKLKEQVQHNIQGLKCSLPIFVSVIYELENISYWLGNDAGTTRGRWGVRSKDTKRLSRPSTK